MLGHPLDRGVRERAQHNSVHPALEIVRDVAEVLAGVETAGGLVDEEIACRPGWPFRPQR